MRLPWRFPALPAGRLHWASSAAPTLIIVAVLILIGIFSSPVLATPANAKAQAQLRIPHVALAQVPWQRHFSHPTPIYIPLMSLPWADCHVMALHLPHSPVKPWVDPDCHFIMAMCEDKQGNLWLATEGAGVYRYDPSAVQGSRWTQFTKQSTHGGLENNCIYAIACDNHDRIWVGELNHGISVFNGKRWQDYDIVQNPKHHVLAGPLGNHVYAMKFDRYTDQMWICTENGISIYQCQKAISASRAVDPPGSRITSVLKPHHQHHWHYITQANGLPMNPDSLAFAPNGMLLVGTQCGGLAIGRPVTGGTNNALGWNHYRWTVIKGPWQMPLTATGKGLPGNLVNSVAITGKNHLAVATDEGVALGRYAEQSAMFNRGAMPRALNMHLVFEHGQNFVAKVHGLWHPPVHWQAPPPQLLAKLPTEDHTTAVAWEPEISAGGKAGYLWLGHWRSGLDVWQYNAQGKIINRWHIHQPQVGNYIQSLEPLKGGAMAVGCYGRGIRIITLPGQSRTAWRTAAKSNTQLAAAQVHEPHGARPPSARELTAMANAIRQELIESKGKKQPRIVPLPDDWRTEGNWLGRYGKYWMCLFGADHGNDVAWGPGPLGVREDTLMGPHHRPGDVIRRWMQPPFFTFNPRALQLPPIYCQIDHRLHPRRCPAVGTRAISELDDHGETYPIWWQGPDENILLTIPHGLFTLGFYEWNYNGHTTTMRLRDYAVSVQTFPPSWLYSRVISGDRATAAICYGRPSKVVARAEQNWGGEWVRFLVRGPVVVAVRFRRNYSFNTHVLGAALDYFDEHPAPYYFGLRAWRRHLKKEEQTRQRLMAGLAASPAPAAGAVGLISEGELLAYREPSRWAGAKSAVYVSALRALVGSTAPGKALATAMARAEYRESLFGGWQATERALGVVTPVQIEDRIKWDGDNYSYRYFEFGVIRREVRAMAARGEAACRRGAAPNGRLLVGAKLK